MKKVTGIGGVFFRVKDIDAMKSWYEEHLGIPKGPYGASFTWRLRSNPDQVALTNWSFFAEDNDYYPQEQSVMMNFRVENLEALLKELAQSGIEQVGEMEEYEYGKFAWVNDPEGNKIELWEPVDGAFPDEGPNIVKS